MNISPNRRILHSPLFVPLDEAKYKGKAVGLVTVMEIETTFTILIITKWTYILKLLVAVYIL